MKVQRFAFVSALVCALIWGANFAADLFFGQTNELLTFPHGFCALIWALAAVVWALRIRRARNAGESGKQEGGRVS